MADIFISYARPTAKTARSIATALEQAGFSVWFDEGLPGHRAYADVIQEQLDGARAVLVIWSDEAIRSQWVRSEADRAREQGKLVQLRTDGSVLPMPFEQIQCMDFRRWRGDRRSATWKQLFATIEELAAHDTLRLVDRSASTGPRYRADASRRGLLIGGAAAVAVAGAAGLFWMRSKPEGASTEVEVLIQKAFGVMQDGTPDEYGQATTYLQEATRLAPQNPMAWGSLAFSHALNRFHVPVTSRAGEEARCRSAARTALALDSDQVFGNCALVMLIPPYRNWSRLEAQKRTLAKRFPVHPLASSLLADLLADLGRWKDAVAIQAKIDRKRFFIPLSDRSIVQSLWSAGEIQRAEILLAEAVGRWPKHPAIWNQRIHFLTHSGKADEAVRLLENRSAQPVGYPDELRQSSLVTAKAILGSVDRQDAVRENIAMLETGPEIYLAWLNRKFSLSQLVAQRAAALGDADASFSLLEGYYFARGPFAKLAPAAGDEDRMTSNLFDPPMSALWREPRFARLVGEIGLEAHWRRSGISPDYQRNS